MSRETAGILRKAKERIGTPDKWHKGDFFAGMRNVDLRDVLQFHGSFPDDCAACAFGAVASAAGKVNTPR